MAVDRIADLVQELEPETAPPPAGAQARQREGLLRAMASADEVRARPRHRRPRHAGRLVTLAGATAAAVVVATVARGPSPAARPPAPAPGTTTVLTAVATALSGTGHDVEEARSTASGSPLSATSWVDLATGACRVDTSLGGRRLLTLFDEAGRVVFVDYGRRVWWSGGSRGVTCQPLTPRAIGHDVAAGRYAVAGHTTVDGQPSEKLVATTTSSGLHPTTKLTTLWVSATTHLPIQSTAAGHLTELTVFQWVPATAGTTAVLDVTVPTGFRHVAPPPTQARLLP